MVAALAALAPLPLGWAVLRTVGVRRADEPLAWWAWAYLLGSLVLGLWMQAAVMLGAADAWWLHLGLLAVPAAAAWRGPRRPSSSLEAAVAGEPLAAVGRGYAVFVLLGAALAVWFAAAGMDRPCIEGDEGNIWSLKAKSLLVDWGSDFGPLQVYNLHPDYPQLNPLLSAWMYVWTGGEPFDQFRLRWPIQLGSVALFVALAAALRRRLPARFAAPLAALVLLEPEFLQLCRVAYADGMVALGLVVALDAGLAWHRRGDRRLPWLVGAGLAYAAWSKNETMLYLAAFAGAWVLLRLVRGAGRTLGAGGRLALLPLAFVVANNVLWNRAFGMKSDLLGANPTGKSMFALMQEQWPERIPALLAEFGRLCVDLGHAHAMFAALAIAAVLCRRRLLDRGLAVPVVALAGALVGLHVVYVGSFLPLRFHLDTSYTRVLFQILPAAVLLLGDLLAADRAVARPGALGDTAARP
ncbi:MAG: hypothetical protein RL398_79 [Planctomycetota bacterium]|jgi:hypothetical protein